MIKRMFVLSLMLFVSTSVFSAEGNGAKSNRIDFSGGQVRGQSNKSGAVYLMNRKKNEIRSMLKKRKHYRAEILDEYPEFRDSNIPTNK